MTSSCFGTVMVVDDDATNREVMEAFLNSEQFEVVLAQSGEAALNTLEKMTPGLVLVDLWMPRMDGLEVCRQIKANYSIPVFIITGFDSKKDRESGFAAGADAFISRPFDIDALIDKIKAVFVN